MRLARSRTAVTSVMCIFATLSLAYIGGARVNSTKSIPPGLYWTSARPVKAGEYVLFCPPQSRVMAEARRRGYLGPGRCPGGYGFMMKRVLAVGGNRVSISAAGVRVNGAVLPLSVPLTHDEAHRPLPRVELANFAIKADQLLLMSDVSSTSFDGRYFGPVERRQIETVIVPVLTW